MMPLTDQLIHNTIRIETDIGTGTGFFFEFNILGKIPAIVTNNHVIKGAKNGKLIFKQKDKDGNWEIGNSFSVSLENLEEIFIPHPEKIDLCILPIAPILREMERLKRIPFFVSLSEDLIPSLEEEKKFTALEEIIMIGYPNGIWDTKNNVPIIRKGITATPLGLEHNGKSEFLIDAACFPGSSGSPVHLINLGIYSDGQGNTTVGNRFKFIGVLYAGPQHTAEGEVRIVEVPTVQKPILQTTIPNNLGYIIKARKILEFKPVLEKLAQKDHSNKEQMQSKQVPTPSENP